MSAGEIVLPELHAVKGIRIGTASAGIKKPGRQDVVVFELAQESQVAAVFTRNAFCAAPVQLAKKHLASGSPRWLVINTGNANAGTGQAGLNNALKTCESLAELTQTRATSVLPFSTGVIGEPLPVEKLSAALPAALASLQANAWADAASGIMTTDTRPKAASIQLELDGQWVTLTGITKGAGMIRPNMATMLGFVATDAKIAQPLLQKLLKQACDQSFNRITIDGDTSTNDACLLIATGQSVEITEESEVSLTAFSAALLSLMQDLAQKIVRDGEGATKFVSIQIEQARTEEEALEAAFTLAHSPLVKTALYASDANWGRILAALGRTPGLEDLDVAGVYLYLGDLLLAEQGGRAASYTEEAGTAAMQATDLTLRLQLGRGSAQAEVWTCDFSHDYVTINAEYRT